MATMSLRMTDSETAMLRRLAEREHRSMNDMAVLAIRRLAESTLVEEAYDAALERVLARDAELLALLAK